MLAESKPASDTSCQRSIHTPCRATKAPHRCAVVTNSRSNSGTPPDDFVHLGHAQPIGRGAEPAREQLTNVHFGQRAELEPAFGRRAPQPGQRRRKRGGGVGGKHHRHPFGRPLHEGRGQRVQPVRVVDQQHRRAGVLSQARSPGGEHLRFT